MRGSSRQMRKVYLAAATLVAFAGSALAQPSTNGPTGNGPEGAPKGIVFGSGTNPPGTTGGGVKATSSHVKKKAHHHM
jgi:hypothetical protein